MQANISEESVIRFDGFALELKSGELRRAGALVKLQPQPFKVLAFLAAHAGQTVTREEIQREIWGDETFVDYEQGVNFCIKQIRAALGDDAQAPRYIETLPRRGYRFIAQVEKPPSENGYAAAASAASLNAAIPTQEVATDTPLSVPAPQTRKRVIAALVTVAVLAVTGYFIWQSRRPTVSPPTGKIMLAVLPFENLSEDPEQDYFSDGLTEEMITQLGRLQPQRLGVIARTSAMTFKKSNKDIARIGRDLGAAYILEGSVRREADRLRITAQLIQVSDQTHLWAETFDRRLDDALTIQSEVAARIAQSLAVELLPSQSPEKAQAHLPSADAHDAYLKGRYLRNKGTRDDLTKSIRYFEQAIEKDASYALAYAELAEAWHVLQMFGGASSHEAYPKAKTAALKALALDDTVAEAHAALGAVRFWYDWNWAEAEQEFKRALALNPSLAGAHHDYGWYLISREQFDDGLAEVKRAQALDPLSPQANIDIGWACIRARRFDEAITQSRRTLELEPDFPEAWSCLMQAYQCKGMFREALAEAERVMARAGASHEEIAALHQGDAAAGMRSVEQWVLSSLKKAALRRPVSAYRWATRYAALGEKEQAFEWLEKAYVERDAMMAVLNTDPACASLRADARFNELVRRVQFASSQNRER